MRPTNATSTRCRSYIKRATNYVHMNPAQDKIPPQHLNSDDPTAIATSNLPGLDRLFGQIELLNKLKAYADFYRGKSTSPEHILLAGSDGMGKRTIARAFAKDYGANLRESECRSLRRAPDLAAILTAMEPGSVLVLLNVQDLKEQVLDVLVHALEQFSMNLIIGQGSHRRPFAFPLNRFTLVATAPAESSIRPELLRCLSLRLTTRRYHLEELEQLTSALADQNGLAIDDEAIRLIAEVAGGTPNHVANLILRFSRLGQSKVGVEECREMLAAFGLGPRPVGSLPDFANLCELSGVDFEKVVSAMLGRMGFRSEITKTTGDGGVDIVASLDKPFVGGRYLIQCKRFDVATQIGAPMIREFYGAVVADGSAVKGIFVTTSTFTNQARDFARSLPIELIDGQQLQSLLEQSDII